MSFAQRTLGTAFVAVVAALGTTVLGVAQGHDRPGALWSVAEAESISVVRSMRVRVRECRGLGRPVTHDGRRRYRHFRCLAGTRAPWQTYDTIAVLFVLHPLGQYTGPRTRYTLTNVRFIGGPGIP